MCQTCIGGCSCTSNSSVLPIGPTGDNGTNGTNGADGADGSTWYDGAGAPSGGTGIDGDYYLNDSNGDVYLKSGGSWSIVANIKGLDGTGAGTVTDVTGTSQTMVADNGYVADNAALVTLTLPVTAAIGDEFVVIGKGAGGWKVAQNASQSIQFTAGGSVTATTSGTGGHIDSSVASDCVHLVCITANTLFAVIDSLGNISYV